jgi:hypothetical protein
MAKTALLNQIATCANGLAKDVGIVYDGIAKQTVTKAQVTAIIARIEALEKAISAMDKHMQGWQNPSIWAKIKGSPAALTASRTAARAEFNKLTAHNSGILGSKPFFKSLLAML